MNRWGVAAIVLMAVVYIGLIVISYISMYSGSGTLIWAPASKLV